MQMKLWWQSEAGAEDDRKWRIFDVITDYTQFQEVLENLRAVKKELCEEAELDMIIDNSSKLRICETAKAVMKLFDALEDLDIQDVYSNFDIVDDILEQL